MAVGYRIDVGSDADAGGGRPQARAHTRSTRLDVRGLTDRLGVLGTLDPGENDPYLDADDH